MASDCWSLIEEDPVFRRNIEKYITKESTVWNWDCAPEMLAAIMTDKEHQNRRCAVFDREGLYQYSIPTQANLVRLAPAALFLISQSPVSEKPELSRIDKITGAKEQYHFPKGTTKVEVDIQERIWYLYGGYLEDEHCEGWDAGAEQRLRSFSLDQLTTALVKVKDTELIKPETEQIFSRSSKLIRTVDGQIAVYDPKRNILYGAHTRKLLEIDHGPPQPADDIICLEKSIVLHQANYIPHNESRFSVFYIYRREDGWNEYSANVEKVFYTEQLKSYCRGNIRVFDGSSFILETELQSRLSKFRIEQPRRELTEGKGRKTSKPGKLIGQRVV